MDQNSLAYVNQTKADRFLKLMVPVMFAGGIVAIVILIEMFF